MSLTLKQFRELTENLPDETVINTTIEFGRPNSLRGIINQVHIVPKEHSYSDETYITLTQNDTENIELLVKKWIDKNKPETILEVLK